MDRICSAYESSSESEEELTPVGVHVKFGNCTSLEKNGPTDFADVQIKEEPKCELPTTSVVAGQEEVQYVGQSYTSVRIKEEPLSSEDSAADSSSSSEDDDSDSEQSESGKKKKEKGEPPKVKGEMSFKDLPPIEDLHISVEHDQCKPIGIIKSVVDPLGENLEEYSVRLYFMGGKVISKPHTFLVIVEAFPNTPALDIDSVLFLDEGDRALGKIYDVIGQVKQPFYCVRFNSLEHIQSNGVEKGMSVYCAPATSHTTYVFLAQLRKMKGTDASWLDDIEPPAEEQEFSDDDTEKASRKKGRRSKMRKGEASRNPNPLSNGVTSEYTGFDPPQVPGFRILRARRRGPQNFRPPSTAWRPTGYPAPYYPPYPHQPITWPNNGPYFQAAPPGWTPRHRPWPFNYPPPPPN